MYTYYTNAICSIFDLLHCNTLLAIMYRCMQLYLHTCHVCFSLLVICLMLNDPTNGIIACSLGDDGVATDGDICNYTCNIGYVVRDNAMRTCGSDGSWSGTQPTCIGKFNITVLQV